MPNYNIYFQSNFIISNIFGALKNCSRHGLFETNSEFKTVEKELKQKCDNNFELSMRLNYYFPNVVVTELTV